MFIAFVPTKAVLVQEKKTDFRGSQTKGSLREGAPDEVGWGRARYNKNSAYLTVTRAPSVTLRVPPSSRRKAILSPDSTPKRCNTLYLTKQDVWKRTENVKFSVLFSYAQPVWVSVLHLWGVLSGDKIAFSCGRRGTAIAVDEELLWAYDTSSVSLRLPPSPTGEGLFCALRKSIYFSWQALILWTQKLISIYPFQWLR